MRCRLKDYSPSPCCTLQDGHLRFEGPSHVTESRRLVVKMETDERIGRLVGTGCGCDGNER